MKKFKFFVLSAVLVALMLVPFWVQASGNLTVVTDVFTDKCTVTASFYGVASEPVSVEVFPADADTGMFSDLSYALQTVVYFNQTDSDESGSASFKFSLRESGEYTIRAHSMNNRSNSIEKTIEVVSFEDASFIWDELAADPYENLLKILKILGVNDENILNMASDSNLLSEVEDYTDIGSFTKENADAFIIRLKSDCDDIVLLRDVLSQIENAGNSSVIKSIVTVAENARVLGITEYMDRYNALGNTKIVDKAVAGKSFTRSEFEKAFAEGIDDAENEEKEAESQPKPSRTPSGGGGSSLGAGTVVAPEPVIEQPSNNISHPFADMADVAWANDAVASLYAKGIINGKSAQLFAPGDSITREEFVKIAICITGIEPISGESAFSDVDAGAWYAPYVNAAVSNGIISGYCDTVFGTGDFVTRQDVAVILDRIHKLVSVDNTVSFSDSYDISAYALEAVGRLSGSGVINGFDGRFMPKSNCTRAEAACMVYRMMALMEGK